MAIGPFSLSKYQMDNGDIHSVRIQPETLTLTLNAVVNAAPAGTTILPPRARVGGSRRSYGIHTRTATIKLTAAGPSGGVGSLIRLPILTSTVFQGLVAGQTGTYNTSACQLVGTSPEKIR